MWKHPKRKGVYEGSYDFDKKTGKRFFELAKMNVKRKEGKFKSSRNRKTYGNPKQAVMDGWTKVA